MTDMNDELAEQKANVRVLASEMHHVRKDISELKEHTARIADAITLLAQQGEKVARLEEDVAYLRERGDTLGTRLNTLERRVDRNAHFVKHATAFLSAVAVGLVLAVGKTLLM